MKIEVAKTYSIYSSFSNKFIGRCKIVGMECYNGTMYFRGEDRKKSEDFNYYNEDGTSHLGYEYLRIL